jgi:hypothetical protein
MPLLTTLGSASPVGFGLSNSSLNKYWIRTFGITAQLSFGRTLTVDSLGNTYVVGNSSGINSTFRSGTLFKLDSSGNVLWQVVLSSGSNCYIFGVAVAPSGAVYVCGQYFTSTSGLATDDGAFIAKYNSNGVAQWSKTLTISNHFNERFLGIALGSAESVYVCGGTNTATTNFGILARFNPSTGALMVSNTIQGTAPTLFNIKADNSGNVYVILENVVSNDTINPDLLISKYAIGTSTITRTLTRSFGNTSTPDYGMIPNIELDSTAANMYVTTGYRTNASGDTSFNILVGKYTTAGVYQWGKCIRQSTANINEIGYDIKLDKSNNIYICGTHVVSGLTVVNLIKCTPDLSSIIWQIQIKLDRASVNISPRSMYIDNNNNIYLTGFTQHSASNSIVTIGYSDLFVFKLIGNDNGPKIGTFNIGTTSITVSNISSFLIDTGTTNITSSTYSALFELGPVTTSTDTTFTTSGSLNSLIVTQ